MTWAWMLMFAGRFQTLSIVWLGHGCHASRILSNMDGIMAWAALVIGCSRFGMELQNRQPSHGHIPAAWQELAQPCFLHGLRSESSFHGKKPVPAPSPLTFCVKVVSTKTEGEVWTNGSMRNINQNSSHPWTNRA